MKRDVLTIEKWREALNVLADEYDAYRPTYPSAVSDDIAFLSNLPDGGDILEIGCGTGQLTSDFAKKGYQIQAVEPGAKLAAHTRRNFKQYPNVHVDVAKLEDWEAGGRTFDLILSAQSFHLLDHAKRFEVAHKLLRPHGSLAIVWNYRYPGDTPTHHAVVDVYETQAPDLATDQAIQDTPFEDQIETSGRFENSYMCKYRWVHPYSADQYVGLLSSHASHKVIMGDACEPFLKAVHAAIERTGGVLAMDYVTRLYVARKRAD